MCQYANLKELTFKICTFANWHICKFICGQSRVRTYVLVREQIYSLSPLTTRPPARLIIYLVRRRPSDQVVSRRRESNPRPADYKSAALPTELLRLIHFKYLFNPNLPDENRDALPTELLRQKYANVPIGKCANKRTTLFLGMQR